MKQILSALFSLLISSSCFALGSDDDVIPVMHEQLMPSIGIHLASSELSRNSITPGINLGLGFRFLREGYFFMPEVKLLTLFGMDTSPAPLWGLGAIAGWHIDPWNLDIFFGADYVSFIDYKVKDAVMGKAGVIFDIGSNGLQLVLDGFYANFTQTLFPAANVQTQIYYPYWGVEGALQFPFDL